MGTAVATPSTDTTSAVDIKTSNETYRVYVKLDADSKKIVDVKMGSAGKDNAFWNKMDADDEWHLGFEQTAKSYKAGTIAGITQIVTDPAEAVNIWNRGASQKTSQKLASTFTELTDDETGLKFDPVEGAFDTLDLLNEETQRRNLSPAEKAINNLKLAFGAMGLTGDALDAKVNEFFASLQN